MINRTIELMLNRRSVRSYDSRSIEADKKKLLFDCAMRAPTAGNIMLYSMIEVTDQKMKDRLAQTCDNQPFIAKAPLVVLFAADYQRMMDFYHASEVESWLESAGKKIRKPEEGDFLLAVNDALIAAQSMVTAAEAMGIGSCYIGDIMENYETHSEMFDLPDYVFPAALVCFGYPRNASKDQPLIPRFDEHYVCFENTYKRFGKEDLLHLYDRLEQWQYKGKPHEYEEGNIGRRLYARKFGSDFSLEMSRSVRAALEKWRGRDY